ncbi:mediator of RNA polymerase II transcription subunit 25-like [Vigna unguiculata]|uniref:mediator of RNA polymerase II transcription subunit 25-like n=1 Tax=Vigna unguiculata TaxID=3917 RepID=UPI001016DBD6|nr:mediator of RNA polymerase II transcription subunit 25-like [Vigna unguiculata]
MAINKWLNIIVDGNSALRTYWPNILSHFLEKILRSFFDDSGEEGTNAQVALVMYNANSSAAVQHIHWTGELDFFLGVLSSLVFNGNSENQHTMVLGLAEALLLFPKPSNVMTKEEYYNGSRHCIVIASGDPVPRRMLVSVPEIDKGRILGTHLNTLYVDFCEVAEMFGPLAVSLSIISALQHPIFGVIFNMGNNGSPLANTRNSNIRIGELNILLARNFKEARDALRGKRRVTPATKESVKSMMMTNEEVANMVDPRGASSSRRAHLPFLAAGFDPYGRPVFGPSTGVPPPPKTPQFNPHDFWPPPPSSTYSQNLVQAWEGTLFGQMHRNRTNTQRGKALRRATSLPTLTYEWSSRLEISFYLPQKSIDYMITIHLGPIDYVFFDILHFNNLDLYEHLTNKNLCAKINLPSQILIISPTSNRHYYIGTIFPADTTFIQKI